MSYFWSVEVPLSTCVHFCVLVILRTLLYFLIGQDIPGQPCVPVPTLELAICSRSLFLIKTTFSNLDIGARFHYF